MSELRPPQIGTYNGYTIATADCCLPETKDLFGVHLKFNNDDGFYIIIGVSDKVRYYLRSHGGQAMDVGYRDNQDWAAHTTSAADAAGYLTSDDNIYYIEGNGERCIRAIGDMCEQTFNGLAYDGYGKEKFATWIMRAQIRKALKLHDPTWQDSNDSADWEDAAAAAKKVVESGN